MNNHPSHRIAFALLLVASTLLADIFSIQPNGINCKVLYGKETIVENVTSGLHRKDDASYQFDSADQTLPDGRRVYNVWSVDPRLAFRLEIEVASDGSQVEFTTKTERPAYSKEYKNPSQLSLLIPGTFLGENATYQGFTGTGRGINRAEGSVSANLESKKRQWRFLVLNTSKGPFTFDCNPIGPGEWCSIYDCGVIRGTAFATKASSGISLSIPNGIGWFGGMTAGKLRIKKGGMENYNNDHAFDYFQYNEPFRPQTLLCFGAQKHGKAFTPCNAMPYDAKKGFGWDGKGILKTVASGHNGAYYTHISGKDGRFILTGIRPGLHIFTLGVGNLNGTPNGFSASINGTPLLEKRSIPAGKMLTASRAVWVENGKAVLDLTGDFIISTFADQFLMASSEDYSIRRGFWAVDGVEPSVLFRNEGYKPYNPVFAPSVMESTLPVPGHEADAPLKEYRANVDNLDYTREENQWLFDVRFEKAGNNTATLNELLAPEALERFMSDAAKKGRNTIMLSGMHSRHTYANSNERVFAYIRQVCEAAHRHNLKVIDHHDTTLLWNTDTGFRLLASNLAQVNRSLSNQLPGVQICVFNPDFRKRYTEYVKNIVRCGVDGLQIDEYVPFFHATSCEHCRRQFHEDTGWFIPVDETTGWQHNFRLKVTKAWIEWKLERGRAIKTELMRECRKINPGLVMSGYSIFKNITSQSGLREWGSDPMRMGQLTGLYGHECLNSTPIPSARSFIPGQKLYNFFRYNNGIPIFTWLYTKDWYNSYFAYAVCNMNAQKPVFYSTGADKRPANTPDFFAFDARGDNMNHKTAKPLAKVALLFSDQSRNWEERFSPANSILGCAQTLEEMHIPYQFIGEDTLNQKQLAPFKVLYLGTSSCLTDAQIQEIRNFAERGGTVIFEPLTATRDRMGITRTTWPLKDLFGFELKAGYYGKVKATGAAIADSNVTFQRPLEYMPPMGKEPFANEYPGKIQLKLDNAATVPAAYVRTLGKGRIIYLPVRLTARMYYEDFKGDALSKFAYDAPSASTLKSLLNELIGNDASLLKTNAPEKIFLTLYEDGDTTYLHLLNGLGTGNPKLIKAMPKDCFLPLDADITFTIVRPNLREITAVSPDFEGRKPLVFQKNSDGSCTVTLPKELLKIYTLVIMK